MRLVKGNIDQSLVIVGAIILILDFWIIYDAIISTRSIAYKMACTIVISLFPFVGLLLYLPITFLFS
ncbi:uncharacterized protein BX663DRAFT_492470 [Cokeromyces recurvatus]|uniref:uncharacterized protein n=1 Tax=Cokeromyces recurvatus TaxID=90255 RepID=UPI0022203AC0|nr:uncharacterized protein BX663DRAFT_492470 [Cokeromyces recurvatus]KAI7907932.1 hypothetical protein BX663DRAFT_492470 [Cokeromyces recurvatus]